MAETNQTETIVELVKRADGSPIASSIELPDGRRFIVRRNDMVLDQVTLENAPEVLQPKVVRQAVIIHTAESLAEYVNRFKQAQTMLFASVATNAIEAVLDYHAQSPDALALSKAAEHAAEPELSTVPTAALGIHVAKLELPFSEQWMIWTKADGQLMDHIDFATFLEENLMDVAEPSGAALLEACRDLQVVNNMAFSSQVRDGDVTKFTFAKENDARTTANVELPQKIRLAIPVYFNDDLCSVDVFLRRQVRGSDLKLGFKLMRRETVRQDAFAEIVHRITSATDVATVFGARNTSASR